MGRSGSYIGSSIGLSVLLNMCVVLSAGCKEGADPAGGATKGDGKADASSQQVGRASEFRALLSRGTGRMTEGSWAEAVEDLSKALAIEADNKDVAFKLGAALLQTARYAEALAVLEPLRKKGGTCSPSLLNNIAWACLKATEPEVRDVPKALMYARLAVMEEQGDADIWGTLAEAHYASGNYTKAFRAAGIAVWLAKNVRSGSYWEFVGLLRRCGQEASAEVKDEVR